MKLIKIITILSLLSNFYSYATIINRKLIDQESLTVTEPLNNSGTLHVDELSLYDTAENNGTIDANMVMVNGNFKNKQQGTVTAHTVFVAAGCNLFENQGALNVQQLNLPLYGTQLKLALNQNTVIGGLFRGDDYLGGISFDPATSRGKTKTVTVVDEHGEIHTFSDTKQNLEKFLEKALNEKVDVTALLAYLRKMTKTD